MPKGLKIRTIKLPNRGTIKVAVIKKVAKPEEESESDNGK